MGIDVAGKKLIEEFKAYLAREKDSSKNTIESYSIDVEEYMGNTEKSVYEAVKTDVISYIIKLQREGKTVSTISRRIAALRNFYGFLLNTDRIKKDPTINISSPKVNRKKPDELTIEEIDRLINTPNLNTKKGIRDMAILETMYSCGLKSNQIINLKNTDISVDYGYVKVEDKNRSFRYIPLGEKAIKAIKLYKENARASFLRENITDIVFLNAKSEKLTRQYIWKMIKEYSNTANIFKKISPEILRHSFAIHMLQNGADMKSVQDLLGNSSLLSMEIYQEDPGEKLKEVYKRTHPRSK